MFDLCAVAIADPAAIAQAAPFFARHGNAFLNRLDLRAEFLEVEFKAIDALDFKKTFAECIDLARRIIGAALK